MTREGRAVCLIFMIRPIWDGSGPYGGAETFETVLFPFKTRWQSGSGTKKFFQ